MTSKSVKLFNLEDRKLSSGLAITEVDIFQWKHTLIDNLKRDSDFKDLCSESVTWDYENVENRGFQDIEAGDGEAEKQASRVHSMLTKIAAYAPKSIVREIIKRTRSLEDVWNIAKEWAGIQSSGSKHLEYYKTKLSYLKNKEETPQEFYYRLRDCMEDTLIRSSDKIMDEGAVVKKNEDMTPCVKSIVVLDWLDALGGPKLVEHIHRVYSKELETCTLASMQSRIWKNLDSLMREIENSDEDSKVFMMNSSDTAKCRYVKPRGGTTALRPFSNGRKPRGQSQRRGNSFFTPVSGKSKNFQNVSGCKLCKANGSANFKSHDITDCWLLNEQERSKISKNYVKAQALVTSYVEENECNETDEDENDPTDVEDEGSEAYED